MKLKTKARHDTIVGQNLKFELRMPNTGKAIQNEVRSKALALALRDIVYLLQ